jgi:hypothetical protein
MSTRHTTPRLRSTLALLALATVALAVGPTAPGADEVLDWNATALEVATAGGQSLPIPISRTWAMVHLAIHDALNSIDRRYEPYAHEARAERDAAPEAAIAAAARDVLAGLIPGYGR